MELNYQTFRSFSCPTEASADALYGKLAMAYVGAVRNRLDKGLKLMLGDDHEYDIIGRAKNHLREIGQSVDGFIPEYGRALKLLNNDGEEDPHNSAVQFVLALHEVGFTDSWSIRPLKPMVHSFAGIKVLIEDYIVVDSSEDKLNIETSSMGKPKKIEFNRINGHWRELGETPAPALKLAGHEIPVLVGKYMEPANLWLRFNDMPCMYDPLEVAGQLQEAADLILEHTPIYGPWIARSLKRLAIVEGLENLDLSRSSRQAPGMVYLSFPSRVVRMAETLVHECSHQHYHLLMFLDPLVNGKDETLYDSPFKMVKRPLERILTTYHAFANVWLFYKELESSSVTGQIRSICDIMLKRYESELPPVLKPLQETDGLSDAGRALWEPLAEQMVAANALVM